MSFHDFGLDDRLLRAIKACGFTEPTPIQTRAIPEAMSGRDILGSAQTGSGKTAAFTLPLLQTLLAKPRNNGRGPRALVLTPTRELATQVADVVRDLSRFMHIRSGTIVGGVSYVPQYRMLERPLDVLVATPGRLIDHMGQGRVDFSRLEVLVLDEADRMLEMGFIQDVKRIADATPEDRQTMLFSATFEGPVREVTRKYLSDPARIELASAKKRHQDITQWAHKAYGLKHKKALLKELLIAPDMEQAVVFTATKRRAKQLAEELADAGHASAALQGNMTQAARRRTVEKMRRGKVRVLVATDVAARGLDVPGISHVINFEMPMTPEDYVHRIGRTGRAGATGIAITLVGEPDRSMMRSIERLTGNRLEHRHLDGVEAPPRDSRQDEGVPRKKQWGHPSADRRRPGGFGRNGKPGNGKRRRRFSHSGMQSG